MFQLESPWPSTWMNDEEVEKEERGDPKLETILKLRQLQ